MSAEVLRRAAELMRERAEAATALEWAEWHALDDGRAEVFVPNGTMSTETVLEFKDHMDCEECVRPSEADLLHITSWHPAVALAVAAWLNATGRRAEEIADTLLGSSSELHERVIAANVPGYTPAVAVARAYLGGEE